mmetsp:Transcript_90813/g.174832  ORF Transcript_90813/g.174832 Transcript_90813/m.174832 type:complete len:383 (+) Transcript_90813:649-1797(+)
MFTVAALEVTLMISIRSVAGGGAGLGISIFVVLLIAYWRLTIRCTIVRQIVVAKTASQMHLSMSTLLNKMCDATVELNDDGCFATPAPQLAVLLLHHGRLAEQQVSAGTFVQRLREDEQERFRIHLRSANEELLLKQAEESPMGCLPTAHLNLHLWDATRTSVSVDVYHVCYLAIDNRPRHMLGILESNHDKQVLSGPSGHHNNESERIEYTVEKSMSAVDSDSEGSSSASSDGLTLTTPTESLQLSCWILPASSDWTICKATVLFNLLWGPASVASLKPQIAKKQRRHLQNIISVLSSANRQEACGMEIRKFMFEPKAFQNQKLGFSATVRIWPASPFDESVKIDIVDHIWGSYQKKPFDYDACLFYTFKQKDSTCSKASI